MEEINSNDSYVLIISLMPAYTFSSGDDYKASSIEGLYLLEESDWKKMGRVMGLLPARALKQKLAERKAASDKTGGSGSGTTVVSVSARSTLRLDTIGHNSKVIKTDTYNEYNEFSD